MIQIFDPRSASDNRKLGKIKSIPGITIVDEMEEQQKEIAQVLKPSLLVNPPKKFPKRSSVWVYYPWRNTLVRILDAVHFAKLRRSRNFNIILPSEQKRLEKMKIAIAGLNVGNPAAICLALEGVKSFRVADLDPLSVSNLNRFRAGLPDLGVNKAILSARQIWEINPFANVGIWDKGISPENLSRFIKGADILVEEMDNLRLKIDIREEARRLRVPVVMVTGNGENVIVDVERYDENPKLKILNGHLRQSVIAGIRNLGRETPLRKKLALARDFMGVRHLRPRLAGSFPKVGAGLAGIPQIAESSFLRGAAVAFVIRQIAAGARVPSGRYNLRIDDLLKHGISN
jgi:tRNA A37 threonylcarbamoyladenosine dehydratase